MLLCSEFVYNDREQVPTGSTPLCSLSYGIKPLPPAGRIGAAANPVPIAIVPLTATRTARSIAKAANAEVQCRQNAYADSSRTDIVFAKGDKLLLTLKGHHSRMDLRRNCSQSKTRNVACQLA